MSYLPGARLGAYEITAKLGEGGMGEVYRARDARLERDVAVKILPQSFASDPDRLMRFEREAKTLASLNHPNIAAIYGIEEHALVMELVEGEDLSSRIARGPIPLDEAVPIAKQIADALEAAHEQGIIHRDLKPANIKVRADGTVKVLDFGLAKALDHGAGIGQHASRDRPHSATITSPATPPLRHGDGGLATEFGVILGTAAYMSPEQAKGKAVNKRADIWAFGVVVYEMLTGTRAFEGENITDTIVAVVSKEPDWSRLPAGTPSPLRRLLHRCLAKDPRQRLGDIADARLELDETATDPGASAVARPPRSRMMRFAPWAVSAILAIVLATSWASRPVQRAAGTRYPIALPGGERIGATRWAPMAVSPDGSRLVYVGESGRLVMRSRDRLESTELAGTEGAFNPFFSPDGTRVGFMSGQPGNAQLRVAPLAGGPTTLVTATSVGGPGASWGTDGFIYFDSPGIGPLRRVRQTGGDSEVVSTLDSSSGELQHDWPDVLPGGRGVLITINRGGPGMNISQSDDIGVLDLATGRHRVLVRGVLARYAASGHLVYVTADGVLMAAPFDERQMEVTGNAVALIEGLNRRESGGIDVALSQSGTLWYATGAQQGRRELAWASPAGEFSQVESGWTGAFRSLSLSPDGTKVALAIDDDTGRQIWIKELARAGGTLSKVTFQRSNDGPRWHPDGSRVSFTSSDGTASSELRSARVDGTGEQSVLAADLFVQDGGWSRDGRWLVYSGQSATIRVFREDIHGVAAGGQPIPLVATDFTERGGRVSPDGRWLAFWANPTSRDEVYVRPFPDTSGAQVQVSSGGGTRPVWSRDGRELFYENGRNELTRVAVATGPTFAVGTPRTLFPLTGVQDWDVAPDGRVILIRAAETEKGGQLVVVEDFFDELKRRVPAK